MKKQKKQKKQKTKNKKTFFIAIHNPNFIYKKIEFFRYGKVLIIPTYQYNYIQYTYYTTY